MTKGRLPEPVNRTPKCEHPTERRNATQIRCGRCGAFLRRFVALFIFLSLNFSVLAGCAHGQQAQPSFPILRQMFGGPPPAQVCRGPQCAAPQGRPVYQYQPQQQPVRYPNTRDRQPAPPSQPPSAESLIDHSQFVTQAQLDKFGKSVQASLEQHSSVINQTAKQLDEHQDVTAQAAGGLAKTIDALKQDVEAKLADLPQLAKTPAGQQAVGAAESLVEQVAGAGALGILKLSFTFGGLPAAAVAMIGWFVLRRNKKFAALEAMLNPMQAGPGGAAPPPAFQGRAHSTADTDGNRGLRVPGSGFRAAGQADAADAAGVRADAG